MPRVSVVLTSFNHERFLREAIDSVLAQTFSDFELFIWDDASTDDSWKIIESYRDPRIRAFRNDETRRAIFGINKSISELIQGEFVAIHHSDDVWERGKLAAQVAFLDSHPEIGAAFTNALAINEIGAAFDDPDHFYSRVFDQPNRTRHQWLRRFFYEGNALCHPSALIRKACYDACGVYRFGFAQVGDLDMWMRLCLKYDIHVLPERLTRFRVLDAERNASGNRPETRIRGITENYRLLRNFLQIVTWKDMLAVFPEARSYHRTKGFEPRFVLAMMALADHPFQFTKLFGVELLFDLLSDTPTADRIRKLYQFDYRDLIALTAQHDLFSHELTTGLTSQLADRIHDIAQLDATVVAGEAEGRELRSKLVAREADLMHMHEAVAKRNATIAELDHAALSANARITELDLEVIEGKARITELDREVIEGKARITELDREVIEGKARITELDREVTEGKARITELDRAMAAGSVRINELEDALKRLGEWSSALEDSLAEARLEAVEQAKEMVQHVEEEAKLHRQMQELHANLAEKRQAISLREADLVHMHEAVAARDKRYAQLDRQHAALASKLERVETSKAAVEGHLLAFEVAYRELAARPEVRWGKRWLVARRARAAEARIDGWQVELANCDLVDADWYRVAYPDIAQAGLDPLRHYLSLGWKEGRNPGPDFDGRYYRAQYSDVASIDEPPLLHYWRHGRQENRFPSARAEQEERRFSRWHRRLLRCPLFDARWYVQTYGDVAGAGLDPAWHYLKYGWREGRNPGPEFDSAYYRRRNPDVLNHNEPLVLHYWRRGRFEGRRPNVSLDFEEQQQTAFAHEIEIGSALSYDARERAPGAAPYMSVIIPTYNRIKLLPGIIDSWRAVAARTTVPFEIIFSDDGSGDGSIEYLESVTDLPIRVLRNEHGGPSRARNAAIQAAKGERLFIIGDDIYPDPDILDVHAALAQRFGKLVATLGVVDWHPDLKVNHLMHHITEVGNEQFSYNRLADNAFTDFRHFYTCNIGIDRNLLIEEPFIFDETFDRAAYEDVELAYRLSLRGLRLFYTTRARGVHFHPYNVEGFGRRQTSAGNMAFVFSTLHPALETILGVRDVACRARKGRAAPAREVLWTRRLEALTARCNDYEALIERLPAMLSLGVRSRLSRLYQTTFRAMHDLGIMQRLRGRENDLTIIMESAFDASWDAWWSVIDHTPVTIDDFSDDAVWDVARTLADGATLSVSLEAPARELLDELLQIHPLDPGAHASNPGLIAPPERATPGLVLETGETWVDEAVVVFRSIFGEAAPVYQRTSGTMVIEIGRTVGKAAPQPIDQIAANILACPSSAQRLPSASHLIDAFLAVAEGGVDIALVSHTLAPLPSVAVGDLRDHMVLSRRAAHAVLAGKLAMLGFSGRVLRLMPPGPDCYESTLEVICGAPVETNCEGGFTSRAIPAPLPVPAMRGLLPKRRKVKPVVFVFPIFLAVGGVERNTVEIMRRLSDRFDFVVVTMERLRPEQGSLAGQALEVAARVIELPEIAGSRDYLRILRLLRDCHDPDIVWVCNGSPWFCDHAGDIRAIFRNVPIIDQEAYDVEQGWISRYGEPGIQSFDFFIAINRKIERRFRDDFGIPAERTRLIYSAIDAKRIRDYKSQVHDLSDIRRRLGLPEGKRLFTFVARLSPQKRPLTFLELARRRLANTGECFVMVGDGELATPALEFIDSHGLRNVVRIPYVANTLELHAVSQGIVFTSAYEGLPIAMLEALSMGVPTFATDVGDIADVLAQFGGGEVIPVDSSSDEIESAFTRWLNVREAHAERLHQSAAAILDRFASENIAHEYAELWSRAMQSRPGA